MGTRLVVRDARQPDAREPCFRPRRTEVVLTLSGDDEQARRHRVLGNERHGQLELTLRARRILANGCGCFRIVTRHPDSARTGVSRPRKRHHDVAARG